MKVIATTRSVKAFVAINYAAAGLFPETRTGTKALSVVRDGETISLGEFTIETIPVAHSIPGSAARGPGIEAAKIAGASAAAALVPGVISSPRPAAPGGLTSVVSG